jgi:hypothetical protein
MAYSPEQRVKLAARTRQMARLVPGLSPQMRQDGLRLAAAMEALAKVNNVPKVAPGQPDLFGIHHPTGEARAMLAQARRFLIALLASTARPSAREILAALETQHGLGARWGLRDAMQALATDPQRPLNDRDYLHAMLSSGALDKALNGEGAPEPQVLSTIDQLLRDSALYRSSAAFQEMIDFMGRFRVYSPYNIMLVRLQNPSSRFFATVKIWRDKFRRAPKLDARPMLILAPMRPVMIVYDLDDTDGPPLPRKLEEFAQFNGTVDSARLSRLVANAERYRIKVEFKPLSSVHAGFAKRGDAPAGWKQRIVIHDKLDEASRFGVLCHELAHILLGHLGTDYDAWWPSRVGLDYATVEIEAEAVAHIVASREGLVGSSAAYLADKLGPSLSAEAAKPVPQTVSADLIAKVAGLIERMARETMPTPKARPPPAAKKATRP